MTLFHLFPHQRPVQLAALLLHILVERSFISNDLRGNLLGLMQHAL